MPYLFPDCRSRSVSHLSPSNTGSEPSAQLGLEPSAHRLPLPPGPPPPLWAATQARRRSAARRAGLGMAAGCWGLGGEGPGPVYIERYTQCTSHNAAQISTDVPHTTSTKVHSLIHGIFKINNLMERKYPPENDKK